MDINRRRFLRSLSAATGLAAAGPYLQPATAAANGRVEKVVVVGAGIVGAAIAFNLAKRGCEVTVIEKNAPASQASGNSFAWINASWYDSPDSYFALRLQSLNEYHRLARAVDIPIRWGGSLEWYESAMQQGQLVTGVQRIQADGAATWIVDSARAGELEPHIAFNLGLQIAWSSRDGAVDPAGVTAALIGKALEYGGKLLHPATVTGIDPDASGVRVQTDVDEFHADIAVLAGGVGNAELARLAGLDAALLRPATPGIIVTTKAMEPLVDAVAYTSDSHFHQLSDGRLLLGEKAGPPDTEAHDALLADRPNAYPTPELAAEHAERVIGTVRRHLPAIGKAGIERVGVGWRPLPVDGLPVIGRPLAIPGLYLAAMHSGVTLAPIVGHLAALEILDGVRVNLLDDFRYERLL